MRRSRWLDLLMIAAIVPLGGWAWRTARERSRLEAAHAHLRERLGHLDIPDRAKFSFRALPTGSPAEFAWRVFQPAGPYADQSRSVGGGAGGTNPGGTEDLDGIWRVRFRDRPDGKIEVAINSPLSSTNHLIWDQGLGDLIRGRWDQVQVEQAGGSGTVAVGRDQPLVLLRLSLSPALIAEEQAQAAPTSRRSPTPEFYRYTLNPQPGP